MRIALPGGEHVPREPVTWARPKGPTRSRTVYAAAHVVADPLGDNTPGSRAAVGWDATLRFRRICGPTGCGSPTRWTPRSATWASTGRPPAS